MNLREVRLAVHQIGDHYIGDRNNHPLDKYLAISLGLQKYRHLWGIYFQYGIEVRVDERSLCHRPYHSCSVWRPGHSRVELHKDGAAAVARMEKEVMSIHLMKDENELRLIVSLFAMRLF